MTIESFRKPETHRDLLRFHKLLEKEMKIERLVIEPDHEFGGLSPDYFGYNVDDPIGGVNLGFLQIIFQPEGLDVVVPQNPLGKRTLETICKVFGMNVKDLEVKEQTIKYAMYTAHLPYTEDL